MIDEMGHEISDRYYKLGSSLDMTCQVALTFLNTLLSTSTKYSQRKTTTTTLLPFINTNQVKKNIESANLNIKWRKDGKELPKNIKLSLRFVELFLSASINTIIIIMSTLFYVTCIETEILW